MKVCIVGATGIVGRLLLKILEENGIDMNDIELYASNKSVGTKIKYKDGYLVVNTKIEEMRLKKRVIILCTPSDVSRKLVPLFLDKDIRIIDCSEEFRKKENVPLIAVGINDELIEKNNLISNPNCVVLIAIPIINILNNEYGVKNINIVSFQSVSGSGKKGLDDLKMKKQDFYPYRIDKTCIPLIGNILDNRYTTEEDKIRFEIKKILNNQNIDISATCVRVPIEACHGISIRVELNSNVCVDALINKLEKNRFCFHKNIPNAIDAKGNDNVFFGRVRKDLDNPFVIHMFVVGDNLYRGAASNAFWIYKKIKKLENIECFNSKTNF